MACGISLYGCVFILLCMCSQVSGDITMEGTMLRFESRLSHLELVVFSMKASLSKLNGRLDKIETAIPQQHQQTTDDNTSVFSDIKKNVEHEQVNRANKAVIGAFISEKYFIRNSITKYEEQFIALKNTVHDQIAIINATIGAHHKRFEQTIKDNELRFNDTLVLHGTSMDIKLQGVRRDFEETLSIAVNDTFIPEIRFIRNTITEYGEQFIELQNTVHDQIVTMNETIGAQHRHFEQTIKDNEQGLNDSLVLHGTSMGIKLQAVRRDFENTLSIAVNDTFMPEIRFIRNTITEYEEQFIELQNTVHDQLVTMNTSLDASDRRFGHIIEETEQRVYSFLEQHNVTVVEDTLSSAISKVELTLSHQFDDVDKRIKNIERKTIVVKAGQCPVIEPETFGVCVEECQVDTDCSGVQKCCGNGCGKTCVNPDRNSTNKHVCTLKKDPGSCSDWSVRWFYDYENGRCDRFWYGGCNEGNGNNFMDEAECQRACSVPGPAAETTTVRPLTARPYDCRRTTFGCCLDRYTPRHDERGSNCEEYEGDNRERGETLVPATPGESVTLDCSYGGEVTWYRNGKLVEADRRHTFNPDGTLVVRETNIEDDGIYACHVRVNNGRPTVYSFMLQVRVPIGILPGPEKIMVKPNRQAFLHCEVYGNPKPTVTWRKGSQPLTSEYRYETFRNGTLLIRSATERDVDNYTCTADNGVTSPVGRTMKLHVELALVCDSGQFMCADSSRCITERWRCDGDFDCPDRSDETTNCPSHDDEVCNPESEFQCIYSKKCIHISWKCDGDADCFDSSDEENCKLP